MARKINLTDADRAAAFPISYMHQVLPSTVYRCYQQRQHLVVMFRYHADRLLGETADSFGCHDAETGELLGCCEDTKKDAVWEAGYELMKRSERAFESQENERKIA